MRALRIMVECDYPTLSTSLELDTKSRLPGYRYDILTVWREKVGSIGFCRFHVNGETKFYTIQEGAGLERYRDRNEAETELAARLERMSE